MPIKITEVMESGETFESHGNTHPVYNVFLEGFEVPSVKSSTGKVNKLKGQEIDASVITKDGVGNWTIRSKDLPDTFTGGGGSGSTGNGGSKGGGGGKPGWIPPDKVKGLPYQTYNTVTMAAFAHLLDQKISVESPEKRELLGKMASDIVSSFIKNQGLDLIPAEKPSEPPKTPPAATHTPEQPPAETSTVEPF